MMALMGICGLAAIVGGVMYLLITVWQRVPRQEDRRRPGFAHVRAKDGVAPAPQPVAVAISGARHATSARPASSRPGTFVLAMVFLVVVRPVLLRELEVPVDGLAAVLTRSRGRGDGRVRRRHPPRAPPQEPGSGDNHDARHRGHDDARSGGPRVRGAPVLRSVQAADRARDRLHRASPGWRSRRGRRCRAGRSSRWRSRCTLASAAAGAFNQYVERDLDARMGRTRRRAVRHRPAHRGSRAGSRRSCAIGAAGVGLAALAVNLPAALYTFLGAFTYGVVYTVWLKRRTWWNIVIGGLAGSFAVLAGAAAVAPDALGPLPLAFAVVLFLWTPPHFWSLAIAFREDYAAAKVPMLPVVVGDARAARAVFAGAALLVAASLVPALFGMGWLYLAAAVGGGALLPARRAPGSRSRRTGARAMVNFHASLIQLTLLLVAAIADAALHA